MYMSLAASPKSRVPVATGEQSFHVTVNVVFEMVAGIKPQ